MNTAFMAGSTVIRKGGIETLGNLLGRAKHWRPGKESRVRWFNYSHMRKAKPEESEREREQERKREGTARRQSGPGSDLG